MSTIQIWVKEEDLETLRSLKNMFATIMITKSSENANDLHTNFCKDMGYVINGRGGT